MTETLNPAVAAESIAAKLSMLRRLPSPSARRAVRVAAGLSAAELADALGVTRQAVSAWERGKRTPRGEYLAAYCAVLDQMRQVPAA